jgi:N-acetylglucosamine kinase-like BadF-type ATPase
VLKTGTSTALTGHLFTPEHHANELASLNRLLAAVKPFAPFAVVAGVTGLDSGTPVALELAMQLEKGLGLKPNRVRVMSDMDLAYRAHFQPGEGILVYAGTGSMAYHLPEDGPPLRAGGWGYLIGDPGGGFAIGQAALFQVMRWSVLEDNPATHPLAAEIYAQLGFKDWERVRQHIYSSGRQAVAALAPCVGRAAEQGDERALEILEQAGADLAALAGMLRPKLGDLPVVLAGGALEVSPRLEAAFRQHSPRHLDIRRGEASFAEAAARLALELASLNGPS